jgi:hypothetical protein
MWIAYQPISGCGIAFFELPVLGSLCWQKIGIITGAMLKKIFQV